MGSVQWLRNGIRKKKQSWEREKHKHNQVESREFSFSSATQGLLNYVPTCVKVNRLQRPSCAPRSREVSSDLQKPPGHSRCDETREQYHEDATRISICVIVFHRKEQMRKLLGRKLDGYIGYINRQSLMTCDSSLISCSHSYLSPQWMKESVLIQW